MSDDDLDLIHGEQYPGRPSTSPGSSRGGVTVRPNQRPPRRFSWAGDQFLHLGREFAGADSDELHVAGEFIAVLVASDMIGTLLLSLGVAGHEDSTVTGKDTA
ncbi:hypothetical protein [Streptomyces coeruleorubidus]|uniref:hypothetical protein n=1 Tax=Streptomyces coeruleorubidus TaxID=116188 RepID=UPI001876988C|nr:hypothetical protein [Streptomyces bellus]GGU14619.1 hypothetical protein GCM10010244_46350 [Streptomyces bellus]